MALILTSDPIMTEEDGQALLNSNNDQQLILVINSVTQKFRQYTGRVAINYDPDTAVIEHVHPTDAHRIWLAASPIITDGKTFTAETIADGAVSETFTLADGDLDITSTDVYASVSPIGWAFPLTDDPGQYVRLTYYGGWAAVPGDILAAAVAQAMIELKRLGGTVGMDSLSRKGESVQYDRGGVIKETAEAWDPYVVWP